MRTTTILASSAIVLAACGSSVQQSATTQELLENPLFANRYYEDLVDTMTTIEIREPDIDQDLFSVLTKTKQDALDKAKEQTRRLREGSLGQFVPVQEEPIGWAALLGGTLYFSSDFETRPGPGLHVYLSTVVDPRDIEFPDPTAIDVGLIQSPYGAQTYNVPTTDQDLSLYRTVVLYDTQLKRLYGFVQLSK